MRNEDQAAFAELWTKLGIRYSKNLSLHLIETYWQDLIEFDLQVIKDAIRAHARNPDRGQYFPQVADITRYILGNPETCALNAWSKVRKAIQDIGSYASLVFDDEIIHATIDDMGGWIRLCQSNIKEIPFLAREFQQRYTQYLLRRPTHYPQQLKGISNWQNEQQGLLEAPPITVGDEQKALQVYQQGRSAALPPPKPLPLLTYQEPDNTPKSQLSTALITSNPTISQE